MKNKKFVITNLTTNAPCVVSAPTAISAVIKYMDTYYSTGWYGPACVDGIYEIYSQDNIRVKLHVAQVK